MRQPGRLLRGDISSNALRLLNVALSRARGKVVILGDLAYLRSQCPSDSAFGVFLREILKTGGLERIGRDWLLDHSIDRSDHAAVEWFPSRTDATQALLGDLFFRPP